jgi:hypothetical protein
MTAKADNHQSQDTFNELFQHAQSTIVRIEEEKFFLNPEKVCIHEGKIYLEADHGEIISLPAIYSDGSGLFLKTGHRVQQQPIWICRKCTLAHYYSPQECERCGGTSFTVRYK